MWWTMICMSLDNVDNDNNNDNGNFDNGNDNDNVDNDDDEDKGAHLNVMDSDLRILW